MADKEWSPSSLLDLFGDPVARATLVVANRGPVAVKEIADVLEVSEPTVYRRVDPLVEANLLAVSHRVDGDGNQHKVYETVLDEVTLAIEDDGYVVDVTVEQGIADDFDDLWSDLEAPDGHVGSSTGTGSHRPDPGGDVP